jgi:ubiquinone/menaquinone biosynthesis C-methylase UbiE
MPLSSFRPFHLFAALGLFALGACEPIRTPGFEQIGSTAALEESVKPGINAAYLSADIDVGQWSERFEVETREVFDARHEIVAAVGLRQGRVVADIGAGTGLFLEPFADAVGRGGAVYALDIAPAFVEHMAARAKSRGLPQVESRLCSERSIDLPANLIDTAFVCDVYHHFEYPRASLASIYSALRPGGELIIIDFIRVPGVSRAWVLDHVRAGQETVTSEIEQAGFVFVEEVTIDRFKESYFLRFRKPG